MHNFSYEGLHSCIRGYIILSPQALSVFCNQAYISVSEQKVPKYILLFSSNHLQY